MSKQHAICCKQLTKFANRRGHVFLKGYMKIHSTLYPFFLNSQYIISAIEFKWLIYAFTSHLKNISFISWMRTYGNSREKNSIRLKTIFACVYINCWDQSLNYFFFKSSLFLHIKIHQTVKFEENLWLCVNTKFWYLHRIDLLS